ncbi:Brp/Blh family beta-carotene 15,15'-dioxygenase [soil metagenome]
MNQLTHWFDLHRRYATVATVVAVVLLLSLAKSLQWQVFFFVFNVLLFGVCHGSCDHLRCPPDKYCNVGIARLLLFAASYLAFAALVFYVWLHDPGPMLVSFLSVSCLHFAMDEDEMLSFPKKLLWGILPVLAPCFLHARDVGQLFGFLTGSQGEFSEQLNTVLQLFGFLVLGLASASLIVDIFGALQQQSKRMLAISISELALLLSYVLLSPLLSFTVYFCWWHSVRQSLKLSAKFDSSDLGRGLGKFIKHAIPFTLGSWLMALILYLTVSEPGSHQEFAQQIRTIFYLLSALTVPHMFISMFFANAAFPSLLKKQL